MHDWITQLLTEAGIPVMAVSPLTQGGYRLKCRNDGPVVANLHFQPRKGRVRVAVPKKLSERAGVADWERMSPGRGWYNIDIEVYWFYVPETPQGGKAVKAIEALYLSR